MAFWIGEFVGSLFAAIFVPLFCLYFAGRKGRTAHMALILRAIAVLLAVVATVAVAVGAGGRFPAGAVLGVVVCFVWACRSTLRTYRKRLNGWQRLGVIVSFIWLPVGFFGSVALFVGTQTAPWNGIYKLCEMNADLYQKNRADAAGFASQKVDQIENAWARAAGAGDTQRAVELQSMLASAKQQLRQRQQAADGTLRFQDDQDCMAERQKGIADSTAGRWWAGLIGMLIPLTLTWFFAWVLVRLCRWVRAGFMPREA